MRAIEIHLKPKNGAFPGVDKSLSALDAVVREAMVNFDWHSDGTYTLLYRLSGTDTGTVRDTLANHDEVLSYEIIAEGENRIYVFVHVTERETLTELFRIAEENALLLDPPFQYTDSGLRVTVAGNDEALQTAFAETTDKIAVDVESTGSYVPEEPDYLDRMTDRQYETLVTAYEMGYYETPRNVSFEEVAEELDCAPSTANELLRRAESELVDAILTRR